MAPPPFSHFFSCSHFCSFSHFCSCYCSCSSYFLYLNLHSMTGFLLYYVCACYFCPVLYCDFSSENSEIHAIPIISYILSSSILFRLFFHDIDSLFLILLPQMKYIYYHPHHIMSTTNYDSNHS